MEQREVEMGDRLDEIRKRVEAFQHQSCDQRPAARQLRDDLRTVLAEVERLKVERRKDVVALLDDVKRIGGVHKAALEEERECHVDNEEHYRGRVRKLEVQNKVLLEALLREAYPRPAKSRAMTEPKLPSAEALRRQLIDEDNSYDGDINYIRDINYIKAYTCAVLEAAAQVAEIDGIVTGIPYKIRKLKGEL